MVSRQPFFIQVVRVMKFFPSKTYQILVLKAEDQGKPGLKWNHGHSDGVAIDSTPSEIVYIVYWVEKW